LPRVEAEVAPRLACSQTLVGGTETIVVVEDEESVLCVVRDMLESAGYRVHAAHVTGGARRVRRRVRWTDPPPFDGRGACRMRVGWTVAERLQRRYPALPVLFMSGYAEPAFADGRGGSVGSHFIAKPFDRQKLLRAVRRAID
jgi:CheY-like chemotaxis protein